MLTSFSFLDKLSNSGYTARRIGSFMTTIGLLMVHYRLESQTPGKLYLEKAPIVFTT